MPPSLFHQERKQLVASIMCSAFAQLCNLPAMLYQRSPPWRAARIASAMA